MARSSCRRSAPPPKWPNLAAVGPPNRRRSPLPNRNADPRCHAQSRARGHGCASSFPVPRAVTAVGAVEEVPRCVAAGVGVVGGRYYEPQNPPLHLDRLVPVCGARRMTSSRCTSTTRRHGSTSSRRAGFGPHRPSSGLRMRVVGGPGGP